MLDAGFCLKVNSRSLPVIPIWRSGSDSTALHYHDNTYNVCKLPILQSSAITHSPNPASATYAHIQQEIAQDIGPCLSNDHASCLNFALLSHSLSNLLPGAQSLPDHYTSTILKVFNSSMIFFANRFSLDILHASM